MDETQTMHAMGIDDAYHVEHVLASGPAGVTELVTIEGAGPFVRKRLPSPVAHREVWAMIAACRSSRIPRIEAMYELPDAFVVVQDYVPGATLAQLVAERGRLAPDHAVTLVGQVGEAVRELHHHGVIHRDLTPKNVIISADGAHLIDFGNARMPASRKMRSGQAHDCGQPPRPAERDTTTLGTYGFAAPEQFGFAPTDARSDIYSLGRLLGFMLTGVYPDDTRYELLLNDGDTVSEPLREAIRRACAFEPSARPPDVDGFLRSLGGKSAEQETDERPKSKSDRRQATVALEPTRAQPDCKRTRGESAVPPRHEQRKVARHTAITMAVAAVLVAAIIGAVMLWINLSSGTGEESDGRRSSAQATTNGSVDPNRNGSGISGDTGDEDAASALTLKESGWSIDSLGYVNYTAIVHNASANNTVEFPSVTITGRDESGKVLFSEKTLVGQAYPGQDAVLTGQACDGTVKPATVEFTVRHPSAIDLTPAQGSLSFTTSDVTVRGDGTGLTTFTGEVTPHQDNGFKRPAGSMIEVVVVLRDKQGGIIYGESSMVDWPQAGKPQPFSLALLTPPTYASYDVYAQAN